VELVPSATHHSHARSHPRWKMSQISANQRESPPFFLRPYNVKKVKSLCLEQISLGTKREWFRLASAFPAVGGIPSTGDRRERKVVFPELYCTAIIRQADLKRGRSITGLTDCELCCENSWASFVVLLLWKQPPSDVEQTVLCPGVWRSHPSNMYKTPPCSPIPFFSPNNVHCSLTGPFPPVFRSCCPSRVCTFLFRLLVDTQQFHPQQFSQSLPKLLQFLLIVSKPALP